MLSLEENYGDLAREDYEKANLNVKARSERAGIGKNEWRQFDG